MVAERAIVRMLLDSHYLYAVIAEFSDTRKNVLTELLVSRNFLGISSHTNVAFVDKERLFFLLAVFDIFMFPLKFRCGPNLCGENLGVIILYDTTSIARDSFAIASIPLNEQFVELSMLHGIFGEICFPDAVSNGLEAIVFVLLPVVHVSFDIDGCGVWSPFAEHPSFIGVVQSEIEVTGCPVSERFTAGNFLLFGNSVIITTLQRTFVGLQIRVRFD